MKIQNVNFIPTQILQQKRYEKTSRLCKKWLKFGVVVLGLAFGIECGFLYVAETSPYYSVPASIQKQYTNAVQNMDGLKKRYAIMQKSKEEDQVPIVAVAAMIGSKPAEIKLVRLEFSDSADTGIQIEGYCNDPEPFNRYVAAINTGSVPMTSAVNKITSAAGGLKVGTIKVAVK